MIIIGQSGTLPISIDVDAIGLRPKPNSASELLSFWVNSFSPATGRMLRTIAEYRVWMSRESIAFASNVSPTSSALNSGLNELRSLGLIEKNKGSLFKIAEVLL